jgi:hypothetical protein
MNICLAPEIRIELILTESKSVVLPLHHSGTFGTQIFKEHLILLQARWLQNKKPSNFSGRGFWEINFLSVYFTFQNPLDQTHMIH